MCKKLWWERKKKAGFCCFSSGAEESMEYLFISIASVIFIVYRTARQTTKDASIYNNIIYFYSSTATFVCSRNTVRESLHKLSSAGSKEHTQENWQVCLSDQWISPSGSPLQSKITDFILFFKSHVFSVYGWLSELTYLYFFSVNLLILYANVNICHSIHSNKLRFSLSCKTTLMMLSCDCIESAKFIPALCLELS